MLLGLPDPDPSLFVRIQSRIRIRKSEVRIRGSRSVAKSRGSTTLYLVLGSCSVYLVCLPSVLLTCVGCCWSLSSNCLGLEAGYFLSSRTYFSFVFCSKCSLARKRISWQNIELTSYTELAALDKLYSQLSPLSVVSELGKLQKSYRPARFHGLDLVPAI
jgi:hypothetical protein